MKKIAIFFTMVIMTVVFAVSANAAEIVDSGTCGMNGDNVKWTLDSDGLVTISGEGKMAEYDYYAGEYPPFYKDDRVVKVVVKDGVTTIAEEMFSQCKNLRSVIFEGYLLIKESAFNDCYSLRFFYASQGFASENLAFDGTEGVHKLFIGNKEKRPYRFANEVIYDAVLTDGYVYKVVDSDAHIYGVDPTTDFPDEVTLPEKIDGYTVTAIEEEALSSSDIKKLTVPDCVTYLAAGAFSYFYTLEEVALGESITVLPFAAFASCLSLKKITLPDTITLFGTRIDKFYGAEYDSNVGAQFTNCSSLEEIVLPSNLEYIPASAFSGCSSLKNIVIPESVKDFLPSFQIVPGNSLAELTVKNVYSKAFSGCDSLENIVLPANLRSIPSRTFYHCDNLTEVYIPGSVTVISEEAFKGCAKLESVIIGTDREIRPITFSLFPVARAAGEESSLNIGVGAFENCTSLVFVSIDKSVTAIAENAFNDCGEITDIFYNGNEADWNKIAIGDNNNDILSARKHYNTESQYTHPFESETVKAADCINEGLLRCTCDCGYDFEVTVKAKGHNTDGGQIVTAIEPTCTEYGEKHVICTVCNEDAGVVEIIKALGHDAVREFVPGSMKKDGFDKSTCKRCNEVIFNRVIPQIKDIKVWDRIICTPNGRQPVVSVLTDGLVEVNKEHYTVKYSGDGKSAGEFIATITFKGDYEGKTKVRYEILPGAVENLKAIPTKNSVKLTWDKVYGAYGYRIYKYNTKTKKYDIVKKVTTKTNYTVEDLSAGTSYKLRVVAYGKSEWGAVLSTGGATVKVKTKLATPKISSLASSSKGKAVIKWSDITGETGYQVYYSTSKDGTYKKYASYKDGKLKATVSGLKSGKKYYFKVRAYDKQNKKTIYSSFSSIKSIKIK